MKAPLVFTSAFGDPEYFECAGKMLASLRRSGYTGRAIVLSDRAHDFGHGAETVHVREPHPVPYKTLLHRYADLSGHGKVLFVDSDILFFASPDVLFEACTDRMLVGRENISLGRNPHNVRAFSPEERKVKSLMATPSINAGALVFPSPEAYIQAVEVWRDVWEGRGDWCDQPSLQRALVDGRIPFGYIPPGLFCLPILIFERRLPAPDMVFAHLCGFPHRHCKDLILDAMTRLEACPDFATRSRLILELRADCRALYRRIGYSWLK